MDSENFKKSVISADKAEIKRETKISPRDLTITKKVSLIRRILVSVKDTAERSSIHGLPSFASSTVHWFVKLVWLVCVAASWGYLMLQINNSIILFKSYNVVSSTSIVYEAPTDFFGKLISLLL